MNEDLDIRLLLAMRVNGLQNIFNVSPFIITNFNRPSLEEGRFWTWEAGIAQDFLLHLRSVGYIHFDPVQFKQIIRSPELYPNSVLGDDHWFDTEDFFITLTPKGLDFVRSHESEELQRILVRSNLETNEATHLSYKSQKSSSMTTNILAGLTAFITFVTLIVTCNQANDVESIRMNASQLTSRVDTIRSDQKRVQDSLTFLQESFRTRLPSYVNSALTTYFDSLSETTKKLAPIKK